jgi:ferredoxin--NADP+ reductase
MTLNVAIIGSGPSGFYTVEALVKADPKARVDLIEALPTPFGLIRFGVAPDHQNTKRVTRSYERALGGERVRYFGNVQIGRDLSLGELRGMYDAVVLAVGAPHDRRLNVPGGDKEGVYGSAEFVSWYNGHPYFRDLNPDLDVESVAVIGNGNVALDVARVLVKTPREMASSDLPAYAAEAIHNAPIRQVHVFGRRGPVEAKFSNLELREMGRLEDAVPVVDPEDLPDTLPQDLSPRDLRVKQKNLATLRAFSELEAKGRRKRVHFAFFSNPVEVLGDRRVEALRLEHTRLEAGRAVGTGAFFEVPCGAVVAAVGYRAKPLEGVPLDEQRGIVVNRDGRVARPDRPADPRRPAERRHVRGPGTGGALGRARHSLGQLPGLDGDRRGRARGGAGRGAAPKADRGRGHAGGARRRLPGQALGLMGRLGDRGPLRTIQA